MDTLHLSREDAKSYMVNYHFLNQEESLRDYESIITVFDRLKSIQYDPLNVVGNNSDLVLQSRISNYKIDDIKTALYEDRFLIDGWDKMMGIYQTKDFPDFHLVREERSESAIDSLIQRHKTEGLEHVDEIISIIKEDGPKFSKDISIGNTKKHPWASSKPSSATLDVLFHNGTLGIKERKNTQKKYDLLKNLIGKLATKKTKFTRDEFIKWYLYRRICSMGLVWNKSSVAWHGLYIRNKVVRNKYVKDLIKENKVQKIKIIGFDEEFYAPYDALKLSINVINKVCFVAPLDNFVWDRELIKRLFDFQYSWEVYTPIIRRKYGYYVLPVLYNNSFIGRIEFEQQRKHDPLIVKEFWIEDGVLVTKQLKKAFEVALNNFKDYLGASKVLNVDKILD